MAPPVRTASISRNNFRYEATGRRTGVRNTVSGRPSEEFERLDGFFERAKSPPGPADIAAGEKAVEIERAPQEAPSKKRAKPYKEPRLSLPGDSGEDSESNIFTIEESQVHAKVRSRNFSVSPSDLSTVWTAPPTPATAGESPLGSHKETPAVVSQAENGTQTINNKQTSNKSDEKTDSFDPTNLEDPIVDDDDIDDEDDLIPPPPRHEDMPSQEVPDDDNNSIGGENDDDGFNHHQDDGFPPSQDDVGLPSEIDAEENKSDDLNGEDLSKEKEARQATQKQDKPDSTLADETDENDSPQATNKKTPKDSHASSKKTPNKSTPSAEEGDEGEVGAKTPESDNPSQRAGAKPDSAKGTRANDNLASDDFGGHEDDYDDDNGDDKEGEGCNIVHDPETPESVREERMRKEEQELERNRTKKAKKKKAAKLPTPKEDVSDSDDTTPVKPVKRKTKKKTVGFDSHSPRGYPAGNREYSNVPIDEFVEDTEHEQGVRRSKRARTKPLEFWRGERFLYGPNDEGGILGEAMGNMPVVKSALKACETPYKKRKVPPRSKKTSNAASKVSRGGGYERQHETPFDSRRLKRKYDFPEGESALVWNDAAEDAVTEKVISYSNKLERHNLPLPVTRLKSEGKVVGRAAQAFNVTEDDSSSYVGYIMGHLALPPKGIKDYESVGRCCQVFTVCHGQPNALELSIADPEDDRRYSPDTAQRFLLGPGDCFRIPQNNTYQLQNHSKTTECLLTWTIIRPHSNQE